MRTALNLKHDDNLFGCFRLNSDELNVVVGIIAESMKDGSFDKAIENIWDSGLPDRLVVFALIQYYGFCLDNKLLQSQNKPKGMKRGVKNG